MGSLNRFNLQDILPLSPIDTLVETGTGLGNSLEWALQAGFQTLYSVEQEEVLFARCRQRFAAYPQVHLHQGQSIAFLTSIAAKQLRHVFYFLDAHFTGGADFGLTTYAESAAREDSYPLLDELEVLLKTDLSQSIIVIDDARMYFDVAYQSGICPEFARRWQDRAALMERLRPLQSTHTIQLLSQDEGYLVIVPKTLGFDQRRWIAIQAHDNSGPTTLHPNVPEVAGISIQCRSLPEIEELQVHDDGYATRFFRDWSHDIDSIRFEFTNVAGRDLLCVDLLLRAGNASYLALGICISQGELLFPSAMGACAEQNLKYLQDVIAFEIANSPKQYEFRLLSARPRIDAKVAKAGRALPGICDYTTATNHIRRYLFLNKCGIKGSVLECAAGTGYGAAILARNKQIDRYVGIDLDPAAIMIAKGMVDDPRFSFRADPLSDIEGKFDYVVSLETIEHVQNPYQFIRELQARLKPEGALIASIPTERWAGNHLNPDHLTNWTYQRFKAFFERHFEEVDIHLQQLSLLGPSPLESAHIYKRRPDEEVDEGFVVVARRPKAASPQTIVVKRTNAMGDVLWITPIIAELRSRNPDACIVAMTRHTDVLMRNPHVDLVATMAYIPNEGDQVIDLDGAYERRRTLHLLSAYAEEAGVVPSCPDPAFYPDSEDLHQVGDVFRQHFSNAGVEALIAVHAGATSPDRVWPEKHWRELVDALLLRPDVGVVLLGQFNDFGSEALGIGHHPRVLDLVRSLNLSLSAAALAQCDFLICVDSGISHLATAVGTSSVVMFGMAKPETRLPFRVPAIGIWSRAECRGCLEELPADKIPVCKNGRGKSVCMEMISTDEVLQAAIRMLNVHDSGVKWRRLCELKSGTWAPSRNLALGANYASSRGNAHCESSLPTVPQGKEQFGLGWLLRRLLGQR